MSPFSPASFGLGRPDAPPQPRAARQHEAGCAAGAKLTITRKDLDDAIKAHYKNADKKDPVELLKAIGVAVK
jgi:hypothetical protein